MALPELAKTLYVKPEPQTTPSLAQLITRENAPKTVAEYHFTPSLREHFKRVFDNIVHRKGQGFWVQAEYGAGKTHFLGALSCPLIWGEEKIWDYVRDQELKDEYSAPLSKVKMFPVAFSLRGMGESSGADSLMRIFEEQIQDAIKEFAPELANQVKITSAELADHWFVTEANEHEKAAVASFFQKEHKCSPEDFKANAGKKKFGQELVRSKLAEGRLKGKYKERFAYIYEQITKLGGYDGMLFVVDEFRSWQDRHVEGAAAYAEDEEILETLAFVLPTQHLNIVTLIASQGDMPQKLSGGGTGDRFMPLYLLADKNKSDFGEIVVFRCRELKQGAGTDIKDYYDHCRKEYRFIKQGNVSTDYFAAIFPFQPRCFEVMRRITQNAEKHNLPTARSAIRMAWEVLSTPSLLNQTRLLTLSDIIHTPELQKGVSHEHYRDGYQNLCGAREQLPQLDVAPEEREQAQRILETLYLWGISLPDGLRDGLTAQDLAEAAWLNDDAVGSMAQAEHLLEKLVQGGFPLRQEKKTRDGKEVTIYSYEISATQESPVKYFGPLKKKAKEDLKGQEAKWVESLFWGLADITKEATEEGFTGGLFGDAFRPNDTRSAKDIQEGKPAAYAFPHSVSSSTRKVNKTSYGGEIIMANQWREEFGKEIENPDQHFRLVYLTGRPMADDTKIAADLNDMRIAACRLESLSEDTRESLADLLAAEQMKRNCSAPNQSALRDYADDKRRAAVKAILKHQQDEYRRGKIITQKAYGIPAVEIFKGVKGRDEDLAGRLLEKAYDTPLFSPKELKKEFTDADAKKVFAGLCHKTPAPAATDAVKNFAVGLELAIKSNPAGFNSSESHAIKKIREHLDGSSDLALSDLKSKLCRPPYGITDTMVVLYVLALIKSGGFEIALKPNTGYTLSNSKALPGDRLTTYLLPQCEWNAKLDKALLGARIVESQHKGWNEVLPFARILDQSLKPAQTPDEEQARNDSLTATLGKLKQELPELEKSADELAKLLGGAVPLSLTSVFAHLRGLATATSYQEFEAAARESFADAEKFSAEYGRYEKARKLRDQAFSLSQKVKYLHDACEINDELGFERERLLNLLNFDSLLNNPSVVGACAENFERWKKNYVHQYRKGHRAYYETLGGLRAKLDELRPSLNAMVRMNSIVELGPPLAATIKVNANLKALDGALCACPDALDAEVADSEAVCKRCNWRPDRTAPTDELEHLKGHVNQGLADRFQRFKDA
jgi:hypothetical protein